MRARVWDEVIFFDGESEEDMVYKIVDISKREIQFSFVQKEKKHTENRVELCLYQALPNKFEKIEYIIQKCTEVGYKKIVFFPSERSQRLVISEKKKERFHKIAIEATEQCGGSRVPVIEYREALGMLSWPSLVCHTQGTSRLSLREIPFSNTLNIIVGPEGGLSTEEISGLEHAGVQKVYFWSRIFRCETVAPLIWFYISQQNF